MLELNTHEVTQQIKKTRINNDTADKLLAKLNEEMLELGIEMLDEKYPHLIKQELADVFIVLCQVAEHYNFTNDDLTMKMEEVKQRYAITSE